MIKRIWLSPTRQEIAWEDEDGVITEFDTVEQRDHIVPMAQPHWTRVQLPDDV